MTRRYVMPGRRILLAISLAAAIFAAGACAPHHHHGDDDVSPDDDDNDNDSSPGHDDDNDNDNDNDNDDLVWTIVPGEFPGLWGVWGAAYDDVFAVGIDDGPRDTIIHFDGASWSPVAIGIRGSGGNWGHNTDFSPIGFLPGGSAVGRSKQRTANSEQ